MASWYGVSARLLSSFCVLVIFCFKNTTADLMGVLDGAR